MTSIYAFSKRIKGGNVLHHKIVDSEDIAKIGQVINRLEKLPKASKLRLDELQIRANAREWANSLVKGYPGNITKREMGYLLSDFTDAMKTRMREESKYAIGLLMPKKLILSHSSFGEETITPQWKTIPRMLDTDNVLRYVCFINEKGLITVRYWEREATSSFIEWLGLPHKEAFLFGGKYRIRCEIENIITEFQLTEQEMESWLESHSEIKDATIKFSSPIHSLNITEIMAGRKRYENPEDFMQDYEAEKQGVVYYNKEYERVNGEVLPLLFKYYDEKTQLVRIAGDEKTIEVTKYTPSFDILFANGLIEFRESYLKDIVKRFINGEPIKIVHAGSKFRTPPFNLECMEIYNEIELDSLIKQIIDYYNEINLVDETLITLFRFIIFKRLADINELPISYLFERLSQEIVKELSLKGKWTTLEGKVFEYKSRDIFTGSNKDIIRKLSDDFGTKLQESSCKVYFIGVEDDGTINTLSTSRLKSDRINSIENGLKNVLGIANIYIYPIVREEGGILLILIYS